MEQATAGFRTGLDESIGSGVLSYAGDTSLARPRTHLPPGYGLRDRNRSVIMNSDWWDARVEHVP
jgi:hypothetical protein